MDRVSTPTRPQAPHSVRGDIHHPSRRPVRGPRPAPQPASPPLDSGSGAGMTTTRCSGAPDTPYRHSPPRCQTRPMPSCPRAGQTQPYRHAREGGQTQPAVMPASRADTACRHAQRGPSHPLPPCTRGGRHSLPSCTRDAAVMHAKAGIQGAWRGIRPIAPERLRTPTGRCNPGARRDMLAQLHSGTVA